MSLKAMTWAFDQHGLRPAEKIVLLALADYADGDGECWPGQVSLAAKCDLSEKTVRAAVAKLVGYGLVIVTQRRRSDGYKTSNLYALQFSAVVSPGKSSPAIGDDLTGNEDRSHRQSTDDLTGTLLPDNEPSVRTVREEPSEEPALIAPEIVHLNSSKRAIDDAFVEFWKNWPRKVGKPNARKAFEAALRRHNFDSISITLGAARYALNPYRPEEQFIPHPTTWLNRDGWNDPLPGPRTNGKATPTDRAMASMASMLGPVQAPGLRALDR